SEQELDEPAEAIGLGHLGSREQVARDGREIPTELLGGVSVADEAQPDRLVALAPNDVEVEEGPLPPRARAAEEVRERPPVHRQQAAIAELPHDAHFGALREPHEDVSALVLGLREQAALEESEVEDVQHAAGEARYELAPQRGFGRGLRSKGRLFEQPGL